MRKRRIFRLKRTKRRFIIRKRRVSAQSKRPEVKYFRYITTGGAPTPIISCRATDKLLYSSMVYLNSTEREGLLRQIAQGTGQGQRVGNHIFLKYITVKGQMWICPAADDANTYSDIAVRVIVADPLIYAGDSNLANFWATTQENKTLDWVDRSSWTVFKDKLFILKPAGNIIQGTTKSRMTPGYRPFKMKIVFNRTITYTLAQSLKNIDKDTVNIIMTAYTPGAPLGTQLACANICATAYYTDA